jgi:hypothetical protein
LLFYLRLFLIYIFFEFEESTKCHVSNFVTFTSYLETNSNLHLRTKYIQRKIVDVDFDSEGASASHESVGNIKNLEVKPLEHSRPASLSPTVGPNLVLFESNRSLPLKKSGNRIHRTADTVSA